MTREELAEKIKELENRLEAVEDIKRRTFLKATINAYRAQLGKPAKYTW